MKSAELLKKLGAMRDRAGNSMFERLGIALELDADLDWIANEFQGDKTKARAFLADEYFADLSGAVPMSELLAMRQQFGEIAVWRTHKFNLQAMRALLRDRDEKPRTVRRSATIKQLEELEEENMRLKAEVTRLQTENQRLQRDNDALRGRQTAARRRTRTATRAA